MNGNPCHGVTWLASALALMASMPAWSQDTAAQPPVVTPATTRVSAPAPANPGQAQLTDEQRRWVADRVRRTPGMDAKQLDAAARQRFAGLSEASYEYLIGYATELLAGDSSEQRAREQQRQRDLEAQRRALARQDAKEQEGMAGNELSATPEATAAAANPLQTLSPGLRGWVMSQARAIVDRGIRPDPGLIAGNARVRLRGQDYRDSDIEALVQLVLVESSRQADADLRGMMEQMRAASAHRAAMREKLEALKDEKDALSEKDDGQRLRLQVVVDRRAKFLETLSSVMKKSSDTSMTVSANLK